MIFGVHPLIALGVLASTAATDAAYVFFNAAVSGRRRVRAANWSAIWCLLPAFAVISYTENATYVVFAATGSWLGAFCVDYVAAPRLSRRSAIAPQPAIMPIDQQAGRDYQIEGLGDILHPNDERTNLSEIGIRPELSA